jgi:segregation and condensation protein B
VQPEAARAIEAILMVAQEPVDPHLLAQLLEMSPSSVEALCDQLQAAYQADHRGFVLARVAGGYRFQSHADLAPYVERFVLEGQSARLSSAALETLAIVAYKQPISRAQVAAIRGVNVDGVMRTLQQRGYVVEVGRDPGPGQATLFGTSREFLERLGLDALSDLPPLNELFPDTAVVEALERSLRADRPAPPEPLPLDDDAPAGVDAPTERPEPAEPAIDLTADIDLRADDDLQPPAWALDDLADADDLAKAHEPTDAHDLGDADGGGADRVDDAADEGATEEPGGDGSAEPGRP